MQIKDLQSKFNTFSNKLKVEMLNYLFKAGINTLQP